MRSILLIILSLLSLSINYLVAEYKQPEEQNIIPNRIYNEYLRYYGNITDKRFLFCTTKIEFIDGKTEIFQMLGVINDTLKLLKNSKEISIYYNQIKSITLYFHQKGEFDPSIGVFTGAYLSLLVVGLLDSKNPTAYITNTDYFYFTGFGIFFGAGILTEIFSKLSSKTQLFKFEQGNRIREWVCLKYFLANSIKNNNIHLSVEMASVNQRLDKFKDPRSYSDSHEETMFNVLRKLQLSFSLNDKFEFGFCYLNINDNKTDYNYSYHPYLYGNSFNVVLACNPLDSETSELIRLIGGIGAGITSNEISYNLQSYIPQKETSTNFNTLLFLEAGFYLNRDFSLAFTTDYLFQKNSFTLIKSMVDDKFTMDSYSFGLTMTYHF